MSSRLASPTTVLLCAVLVGCSTTVQERPAEAFAPLASLAAGDYPGAAAILSGFAPADDDPALRIGDAALFALDLRRGEEVRRELLLLDVVGLGRDGNGPGRRVRTAAITWTPENGAPRTDDIRLHEVEVALRRFDAAGRALADTRVVLFEEALRTGWWPDTDLNATRRQQNLAFVMTMSLQNLIDSDPTLQELLFLVADRPSLLSIAAHLGVKVDVQTTLDPDAARQLPPFPELPADTGIRVTNKDLTINGSRALWVDLLVTPPVGALRACGGLLGAVAHHAGEPGRWAAARLLATRRGP